MTLADFIKKYEYCIVKQTYNLPPMDTLGAFPARIKSKRSYTDEELKKIIPLAEAYVKLWKQAIYGV